jgi:hypothetical protein
MHNPVPVEALTEAAGQAQAGPTQQQIDESIKMQKEQMAMQTRVQRVNVAFSTMDKLTEHCRACSITALQGSDEKLWDTCVAVLQDFLAPQGGLGRPSNPLRIGE